MKTGIELITEERKEQIEKHGYDQRHDTHHNNEELIDAALFAINRGHYPNKWENTFRNRLINKDRVGRLKIAGALLAAEIDRLQYQNYRDKLKEKVKR